MIVAAQSANVLKLFAGHVLHTVTLWQNEQIGLQEAVDGLREKAVRHGLVHAFGVEEVEWIIGASFAEVGVHYGDIRPKEGAYP